MDATTFTESNDSVAQEYEPGTHGLTAIEPSVAPRLTVKASLRSAFLLVLMGTAGIGLISVIQIWRVDNAAALIYTEGFAATQAVESIRASVLQASRFQSRLLMAATARERDDAAGEIEQSIQGVATTIAAMDRSPDETSVETNTRKVDFRRLVDVWSQHLRTFNQLVADQPLYHSQMSWQVALQDTQLRAEQTSLSRPWTGLRRDTKKILMRRSSMSRQSIVHPFSWYLFLRSHL